MADQNAPAGANNDALAQALQALAGALQGFQQQQQNQQQGQGGNITHDPFASPDAFDLGSRAGSNAFSTACAALDETWDGTVEKFPAFVVALRIRASECNWAAAAPQGIVVYNIPGAGNPPGPAIACNLLEQHHSISTALIETARAGRNNPHAVQNSRAIMYKCLKASITGDLKATLFDQLGNLPAFEDGPTLFKRLTTFTMAASLELSMMAFKDILEFDPSTYKFNVPSINTKLAHLFVLATTRDRSLDESERVQHTLALIHI